MKGQDNEDDHAPKIVESQARARHHGTNAMTDYPPANTNPKSADLIPAMGKLLDRADRARARKKAVTRRVLRKSSVGADGFL
jgi:hypothetical protein